MTKSRDELLAEIAKVEASLSSLDAQRERVRQHLEALLLGMASVPSSPVVTLYHEAQTASIPKTPADKVRLFRSLFRGRPDVYPTRFISKKTSRFGYAPACGNKFVLGVCELPRIRCGDCQNQAFHRVGDQVILGHLQGRHVMGVYPLLEDDTCWFLAADFDKTTWREDVTAFTKDARQSSSPNAVITLSTSPNG